MFVEMGGGGRGRFLLAANIFSFMLGGHLCEKHQNKIREEFIISSTTNAVP